jgi:hypothetical protein
MTKSRQKSKPVMIRHLGKYLVLDEPPTRLDIELTKAGERYLSRYRQNFRQDARWLAHLLRDHLRSGDWALLTAKQCSQAVRRSWSMSPAGHPINASYFRIGQSIGVIATKLSWCLRSC